MRNSVPLLCLWGVYCCFAAGSSTPPGPEGRLQGNVHLFLLPPHSPPTSLCHVPSLACRPLSSLSWCLRNPPVFPTAQLLHLMSFAVHLLLGASEEDIPSEASEKPPGRRVHWPVRSPPRPTPSMIRFSGSVPSNQQNRLPLLLEARRLLELNGLAPLLIWV